MTTPLKIEDVNVRLHVTASFCVTAGLYGGTLTRENIAALVDSLIEAGGGIEHFIDRISIAEIANYNDDTTLVSSSHPWET